MDRHFMSIAIIGVIALGACGLFAGCFLIYSLNNPLAGAVCLSLSSGALGILGGILAVPKIQPQPLTVSDIINQAAINAVQKGGAQ